MENKKIIEEEILSKISGGDGVIDDLVAFFGSYDEIESQLPGVLKANVCPKCGKQIGPYYIELEGQCGVEDLWDHIKKCHK